VKRLAEFVRSVIPADPFQLLFIAGVVCLVVAHGLRWWPSGLSFSEQGTDYFKQIVLYMGVFFVYPIIFSGMTGYFVCFWPGGYPVRRVLWLVCAPSLLGLGLMFGRVLYLSAMPSSILESTGSVFGHELRWVEATLWKLPEGFHFTLLGLLLIGIFTARLTFGISSLPIALPGKPNFQSADSEAWRQLQILIFILVGPLFLAYSLVALVGMQIPLLFFSQLASYLQSAWVTRLFPVLGSLVAYGVLLCFMGREERQITLSSVRRLDLNHLLLAVAFPVGIEVMISLAQYLPARVQWAAHEFGRLESPQLGAYFTLPEPWLFLLFFAALCEELIFRGLLQPRFIQRYGIFRGIFFVGVVWAAFHFFSDFSFSRATDLKVLEYLSFRLFMCVTLSFVFGWLTLRSGSIFPASVAHTLFNVLIPSDLQPFSVGKGVLRVGLWVALAYVLFRYRPVRVKDSPEPASEPQSLESAL
jgi:membrane protease YdiL (CAAX protease family)